MGNTDLAVFVQILSKQWMAYVNGQQRFGVFPFVHKKLQRFGVLLAAVSFPPYRPHHTPPSLFSFPSNYFNI